MGFKTEERKIEVSKGMSNGFWLKDREKDKRKFITGRKAEELLNKG